MPAPDWLASVPEEAGFLRLVLDHVSDCLVAVDTAGRIVLINRPYCRLLGGEEADFIGRHITDVVGPQTHLHLVARGEPPLVGFPLEVRGHRLVTKQVPVLQDGKIIGAVGLALFSDVQALQKTYSRLASEGLAIENLKGGWVARFSMADILGEGATMSSYRENLRQAATHDLPVLLLGETGTGKELAAHTVHQLSKRANRPFVWLNCGSIPSELIEADLFGYEGGAFTGARTRGKLGKFEIAAGGTLFLDEIGDMPFHLQASLLRVLQANEIVRVGGTSPIATNVRIVCATNRPLRDLVRRGEFRSDLFFRLNVFEINVPALRVREDRPFLIAALTRKIAKQLQRKPREFSSAELARLSAHDWPGNIRELEGALTRFIVTGNLSLSAPIDECSEQTAAPPEEASSLRRSLAKERANAIQNALRQSRGNKKLAAQILGISRAQLYRELAREEAAPRRSR